MASLREISGRFYLRYRDNYGEQRSKPLGKISRKQAERERDLFDEMGANPSPGGMRFGRFIERYNDWHKHEFPSSHGRVAQIIEDHLDPVFKNRMIGVIDVRSVEQYKVDRGKVVSPGSVEKEIRTLKAILNKAVEWGLIKKNPIAVVRSPRVLKDAPPPYYTADELVKLYGACVEPTHRETWRFAANTGLRRSELLHLKKEDLRDQGVYVVSRDGRRTKSGRWRLVPWCDGARQAADVLDGLVDGEFVIPRVHPASLSRAFGNSARRAKLPGSIHWLRHSYASHLVMGGFPMRMIQQVMGHSTIAVTERYAHLADDFVSSKMAGFSI